MANTPGSKVTEPLTVERAQLALGEVVNQLLGVADALELVHESLPPPADLNDRQEHRKPFDVATEVLATIECALEDYVRPAIRELQRAGQVTDADLEAEFFERRSRGLS
ncbi:MAG: hypothetical protein ABJC13_23880 [Acidobacteriota bacterium]